MPTSATQARLALNAEWRALRAAIAADRFAKFYGAPMAAMDGVRAVERLTHEGCRVLYFDVYHKVEAFSDLARRAAYLQRAIESYHRRDFSHAVACVAPSTASVAA